MRLFIPTGSRSGATKATQAFLRSDAGQFASWHRDRRMRTIESIFDRVDCRMEGFVARKSCVRSCERVCWVCPRFGRSYRVDLDTTDKHEHTQGHRLVSSNMKRYGVGAWGERWVISFALEKLRRQTGNKALFALIASVTQASLIAHRVTLSFAFLSPCHHYRMLWVVRVSNLVVH